VNPAIDPAGFIRENLTLKPGPSVPEISLYTAHSASGLMRLASAAEDDDEPPYWAYPWGGGIVLARHILDHPQIVRGRRVLDLGAGGGLVAIAAARAGAAKVLASEIDGIGRSALALNAQANGVAVEILGEDLLEGPPPRVDLVLVGDLFYERALAARVGGFLDRCAAAGIEALVGDPGRTPLPRSRLATLAEYPTPDFGQPGSPLRPAAVFAWRARALRA
jgi:predicted nicotinamide N-methyase